MFGRFGGEGTDQEGRLTQQVERLQYVYRDQSANGVYEDTNSDTARAVAAAE